jgi:hypothetical protein
MQEFTIQDNNPSREAIKSNKVESKGKQKTSEKLPPIHPSKRDSVEKSEGGKKKRNCLVPFLIFLVIIFVIISGLLAYLYYKSQQTDSTEETTVEDSPISSEEDEEIEEVVVTVPESLRDKIIYSDFYNIYIAEKDGSDEVQLTSYPEEETVRDITLIDENNLGYFRCIPVEGDFGCEIFTIEINSKAISSVKDISADTHISQLTWIDLNTYLYASVNEDWTIMTLTYETETGSEDIVSIPQNPAGRGGFIEDDVQLRFSPNAEKFYYIYTGGDDGFDFSVYVYDLEGALVDEIEDATKPYWVDDATIVYRSYSNEAAGYLYQRDLNTNLSEKLEQSTQSGYDPRVLDQRIVYWEASGTGKTYLYDLESDSNEAFDGDTAFAFWLTEDEVIAAKTRACGASECQMPGMTEMETQFLAEDFYIFNLETSEETKIELDAELLRYGAITWYNRSI